MPTPPTKPTPPTPPSMTTTPSTINSENIPSSPATINSSNSKGNIRNTDDASSTSKKNPSIESKSSATDKNTPTPPPLGNYKEASSQTLLTPVTLAATKKSSSSIGFSFLFSFILLIAIAFTCFHLWKNNTKQRTVLDYSTDSSKELLNLMNSPATASSLPQQTIVKRNKAAAKIKGNFEVRI